MAIIQQCSSARHIGLAEYLERIESEVLLHERHSLMASAPLLQALANNPALVVDPLNAGVATLFEDPCFQSPQILVLGRGRGFYVRAAIWPSSADVASGRAVQSDFTFELAHDHNYDLMTANHFGPGYVTDIYEYDNSIVTGYLGEAVDLRFLQRLTLARGTVLLYRASTDIHVQYPPKELSITVNLMVHRDDIIGRDQYYFDVDRKVIIGYPAESQSSLTASVIELAGRIGDENTVALLQDLAKQHPSARARMKCYESLVNLCPQEAEHFWKQATSDPAKLITQTARAKLRQLNDG